MRGLRGSSPRRWWRPGSAVWPGDGGPRWWPEFLDGAVFGARRTGVGGGIGCSGEMVSSWALYIGWGWLVEATEERSQWWPVEFNGAAVLSLESTPRGRGNGGVAPLRNGKWRWHGSGHGGSTRHDSSRLDERWRCGIGPEEGDKGGAGRVGCKGQVGRFQKCKTKMKMELGWLRGTFEPNSNRATEKNRKLFFKFLFQGNGIQIKCFEYFQTKFELDSK
jgi:hypothetical protein